MARRRFRPRLIFKAGAICVPARAENQQASPSLFGPPEARFSPAALGHAYAYGCPLFVAGRSRQGPSARARCTTGPVGDTQERRPGRERYPPTCRRTP